MEKDWDECRREENIDAEAFQHGGEAMTGRLTPITGRDIDGQPNRLLCGHPVDYDAQREDAEAYSCPACAREWEVDVLRGRFGAGLRALMSETQGALL